MLGYLTSSIFSDLPPPLPLRYAGVTLSSIFLWDCWCSLLRPKRAAGRCRSERRAAFLAIDASRRQFGACAAFLPPFGASLSASIADAKMGELRLSWNPSGEDGCRGRRCPHWLARPSSLINHFERGMLCKRK